MAAAIAKNTRATRMLITIMLVIFGVPSLVVLVILELYVYFRLSV